MPNWVYTSMSVSGRKDDLLAFAKKAIEEGRRRSPRRRGFERG